MQTAKRKTVVDPSLVPPRSRYARRRALCLASVYVLMAIHVVHWRLSGKTMAPLEFNEVMYTAELGIVTAGFLFMLGAVAATAIFGRFFCSWGCHILALQDLCAWILGKLHLRPRPIRSRLLLWVPTAVAAYMFIWPQVVRLWFAQPTAALRTATDAEGWASFSTTNFWRNLPGPGIIFLTFLVCGFIIVYVLGSRSFCAYGCPYGAVFSLTDRIAPGRIRMRGADCTACGTCTAVCQSHIRVHEELNRYGMVVNSACLKDLDCVSACPQGNIKFGFGMPSAFASVRQDSPVRKLFDFAWWEEGLMLLVFVAVLFTFRGLYDLIPFFLAIALAVIAACLVTMSIRLIRRESMQWNKIPLKSAGQLRAGGIAFLTIVLALGALTAHSGLVRYESFQGRRLAGNALSSGWTDDRAAARAVDYLESAARWGLMRSPRDDAMLSKLHYQIAGKEFRAERREVAEAHLRRSLAVAPNVSAAHYELGALLVADQRLAEGIDHLRIAAALQPDFADAHYNLAVALWMSDRKREALEAIDRAFQLNPDDSKTRQLRQIMKSKTDLGSDSQTP